MCNGTPRALMQSDTDVRTLWPSPARARFDGFDEDGSGDVSNSELVGLVKALPHPRRERACLFAAPWRYTNLGFAGLSDRELNRCSKAASTLARRCAEMESIPKEYRREFDFGRMAWSSHTPVPLPRFQGVPTPFERAWEAIVCHPFRFSTLIGAGHRAQGRTAACTQADESIG